MHISIIGTGYVGLVSGACFSEFGIDVTCIDLDSEKIDSLKKGKIPIYEPGLEDLVAKNVTGQRLHFKKDLNEAVSKSDAVFIAVGTPSRRGDGHADLSYVFAAASEIASALEGYTVVVNKSTVPVGTGREVEKIIRSECPEAEFDIVSNPEFLREGSAIEDFMRPDRVVIGVESERAQELMSALYRPLHLIQTPILFTKLESAELVKYATNAFLATKVTFINEVADLCEKVGANVHDIAKGMGLDGRIGNKFLHAGPGYGGSCFPKDTLAMVRTAESAGVKLQIVESVVNANTSRKKNMANRIIRACGDSVQGKTIALLGVTFKPNTDDMRDSPSLEIIPMLSEAGAKIRAYDPAGMEEAKHLLENVDWCEDTYDAVEGADALVIVTEWNEFRSLNLKRIKKILRGSIVVDLRNIYDPETMMAAGFEYSSIGRPSAGVSCYAGEETN